MEELKDLYQDKLEENEEGLYNKEENIKKVEKRLKEVEIYIHKLTITMTDKSKQRYYQDFTIRDFLEINNEIFDNKSNNIFNYNFNNIYQKSKKESKRYNNMMINDFNLEDDYILKKKVN